jgi:hypothetical protein
MKTKGMKIVTEYSGPKMWLSRKINEQTGEIVYHSAETGVYGTTEQEAIRAAEREMKIKYRVVQVSGIPVETNEQFEDYFHAVSFILNQDKGVFTIQEIYVV